MVDVTGAARGIGESTARKLAQRGLPWAEIVAVLALRGVALAELLFLAARPVTVQHMEKHSDPYVAVVVDRSMSMSLTERGQKLIRHYRAIERKALSATATHLKALQAISRSPRRG